MPVELVVAPDYAAHGRGAALWPAGRRYSGPVSYVLGKERAALEPVAKPMHSHGATFTAVIIAPASGPVTSLEDLREPGRRLW